MCATCIVDLTYVFKCSCKVGFSQIEFYVRNFNITLLPITDISEVCEKYVKRANVALLGQSKECRIRITGRNTVMFRLLF